MSPGPYQAAATSSALEALKRSEKLFRALIENSSDVIALVSQDGTFLYVSPSVQRILGFTPDDLLGRNVLELIPRDQLTPALESFKAVSETPGLTVTVEHTYTHKDGSPCWLESTTTNRLHDPDIQAFVANFRDVSERKAAAEELQQSKSQLEVILKNIADGITVQDASGNIIYANQAAAIASGYTSAEELVNAPPLEYLEKYELTDESGRPFPPANLPGRRAIQGEENPQVTIRSLNRQTQEVIWSMVRSTAIYDGNHRPYLVISAMHDITQFKELEQRKDAFISMASHELKTPVTSIKGFTQLLQNHFKKRGDEDSQRFLARMDGQLNKLTQLISDLLEISKMQAGKLALRGEWFDLGALIQETVENIQGANHTHSLLHEGDTHIQIFGDKDRLGQVLINLLTNAIKYSPQSDKVIIKVSTDQDNVLVSIQDFGIGIAENQQERVFERFYQVGDPQEHFYPGLGIGLYISNEIIKRHQGCIEVESVRGHGSIFSFRLPLHSSESLP
jgi:two-component system phosphate regulon sensor histidine kinase PhoR